MSLTSVVYSSFFGHTLQRDIREAVKVAIDGYNIDTVTKEKEAIQYNPSIIRIDCITPK